MHTPRLIALLSLLACTLSLAGNNDSRLPLLAQDPDEAPWQEAEVPPPPSFNADQLVPFELSRNTELSHGIAPGSLSVGSDGVVRYVRVARSRTGTLNALYEGVRCNSAEVRTYAYWVASEQRWQPSSGSEWRALDTGAATLPAKVLARSALCDGPAPNSPPDKILRDLRYGKKF